MGQIHIETTVAKLARKFDVAVNLDRVYRLAMARIARINPFNEAESAEAAIRVLTPQANAWRKIDADEATADLPDIETLPGVEQQTQAPSVYAA